eukprot:TRINITY_DN248_c0_g1_i12.p1 TRINITY_DN248_c0_g1~~TRINITY_DN248_c0_g1_i12.p1  ORF type:complete len:436 (+),score=99.04 TRINITY_DN248_c0_g1_i12:236-1543(+)
MVIFARRCIEKKAYAATETAMKMLRLVKSCSSSLKSLQSRVEDYGVKLSFEQRKAAKLTEESMSFSNECEMLRKDGHIRKALSQWEKSGQVWDNVSIEWRKVNSLASDIEKSMVRYGFHECQLLVERARHTLSHSTAEYEKAKRQMKKSEDEWKRKLACIEKKAYAATETAMKMLRLVKSCSSSLKSLQSRVEDYGVKLSFEQRKAAKLTEESMSFSNECEMLRKDGHIRKALSQWEKSGQVWDNVSIEWRKVNSLASDIEKSMVRYGFHECQLLVERARHTLSHSTAEYEKAKRQMKSSEERITFTLEDIRFAETIDFFIRHLRKFQATEPDFSEGYHPYPVALGFMRNKFKLTSRMKRQYANLGRFMDEAYKDTRQACKSCGIFVYPFEQRKLERREDGGRDDDDDSKHVPHVQELCEKCRHLPHPCSHRLHR